jgi:hypothetical protein
MCVYKPVLALRTIQMGDNLILTKDSSINVLAVIFDNKISWSKHVRATVNKSNRALNAMKLVRKYFNTKKVLQLITSNFFQFFLQHQSVASKQP